MMLPEDALKTSLLDLAFELCEERIPLILGGGYGLYLKQKHMQERGAERTLLDAGLWPAPRVTADLDIFLQAEVVTNSSRMKLIAEALARLGFAPVESAKYMQFIRHLSPSKWVKIDLLVGPLGKFNDPARVRVDDRRVRPRPSVSLHAHRVDEAVGLEHEPMELAIRGVRSNGQEFKATVFVPQALPYLLMKLMSFRDQEEVGKAIKARHHALDLYRIVAMLTEGGLREAQALSRAQWVNRHVVEARRIVHGCFAEVESKGALRLREHELFRPQMDVDSFLLVLKDLFPAL